MGIEVAVAALATVAVASEEGKAYNQIRASNAQTQALDLQAKQQQVAYEQKSLSNLDILQNVLDKQTAAMTVSGASFASPSFNAIQRQSINIGAKQAANLNIEEDFAQANIKTEKANVKSKLYAELFGDVSGLAMKGIGIASGMPSGGA